MTSTHNNYIHRGVMVSGLCKYHLSCLSRAGHLTLSYIISWVVPGEFLIPNKLGSTQGISL